MACSKLQARVYDAADETIPNDAEQATGLEKKELDALLEGKEVILINAHLVTWSLLLMHT